MLTEDELNKLENSHYFREDNLIGKGMGGKVYKINNRYVVKKIVVPTGVSWLDYYVFNTSFKDEVDITVELSSLYISPFVVYHSKPLEKQKYIVIEKLDCTLHTLFKNNSFSAYHLEKLKKVISKLCKTRIIHRDLHLNNIMWSEKYKEFRIIDWGNYETKNKFPGKKRYKHVIKKAEAYLDSIQN